MYKVDIDFDEARNNKKHVGTMFYYRCLYRHRSGKSCSKTITKPKNPYVIESEVLKTNTSNIFCYRHRKRLYLPTIHTWE